MALHFVLLIEDEPACNWYSGCVIVTGWHQVAIAIEIVAVALRSEYPKNRFSLEYFYRESATVFGIHFSSFTDGSAAICRS